MTLNSLTLNGKTYDKFPADRTRGLILPAEITGNAASTISVPMSLISIPLSGYKPSIGDMVLTLDNCLYKITGFTVGEETEYTGKLIRTLSSGSSPNVDLTGYAKETWVQEGFQPKGDYLTEHQDISGKLDTSELPTAINAALEQAKESGEFEGKDGTSVTVKSVSESTTDGGSNVVTFSDGKTLTIKNGSKGSKGDKGDTGTTGATGQRGTGLLPVTTAPSSYTTAVGGITPKYRMAISTIKTQAGVTEVLLGDTVRSSYYHYPIDYLDASYAYFTERVSIRGATGAAGVDGKDYSFDPTVYGLPVLELTGDTTGMNKDNAVNLSYVYGDNSGSCTLKWQGSSSLAYDKKNYTIKFGTAVEIVEGWGAQTKYCLKANFIDHSHARNIVCAKLWGQIVKSRKTANANLNALPNGGAIDGFPIIIMLNGEFHGLYTWNIPKDGWMFGMGSGAKEAIVGADNQAEDTAFKTATLLDAEGLELEYSSDGFTAEQVKTSLNQLINACIDSWGGDLDTEVAKYLDWESAIDYFLFVVFLDGGDMTTKNYLLSTFDGTKWHFSAYDMDSVMGLRWDGKYFFGAHEGVKFDSYSDLHRAMELIYRYKTDALKARWTELRGYYLTESRICRLFENFACAIPSPVYLEDVKRWPSIPGSSVNNVGQILRWVRQRLAFVDEWVDALPEQEIPVEPSGGYTNVVSTSIDTDGSIYNGTGYKDDTRLSSSGGVSGSAQAGSVTVGLIPFAATDVIRMKGAIWKGLSSDTDGHYYLHFYNASKTKIEGFTPEDWQGSYSNQVTVDYDATTGVTTFDVVEDSSFATRIASVAYIRLNAKGKGADLIITKNEEIT